MCVSSVGLSTQPSQTRPLRWMKTRVKVCTCCTAGMPGKRITGVLPSLATPRSYTPEPAGVQLDCVFVCVSRSHR